MFAIAVFGCGYVGMVTAACLAALGNRVCCYDTDWTKISSLECGNVPFYEPRLEALVRAQIRSRRLRFATSAHTALQDAQIAFLAVGTPTGPMGEADLTYVRQACDELASHGHDALLVVNKSTVPVETADLVERLVNAPDSGRRCLAVVSNPEFLREGSAVADFMHPDRIVIGSRDRQAVAVLRKLYEPLGAPILVVDPRTAEMIKYAANAFLATKISFINEIANLCGAVDADVDGVIAGIGADARIGPAYLQPGLGFGGSCLPKDVAALAEVARAHDIEPTILDATMSVNRRQILRAVRFIEDRLGDLCGRPLAVAGAAFKGGTDDLRASPALVLIDALLARGAVITLHDSYAGMRARRELRERVKCAATPYEACTGASALIVANDDRAYAKLDWRRVAQELAGQDVVDLRNRVDRRAVRRAGLRYGAIGRPEQTRVPA